MLTLVAAVDVYDLAAEGATDAFELLSSPRLSRYAISWTSVEKDIMVMNWRWAVCLLTVEFFKPQGRRPQGREKYFSKEIANRESAQVQLFKGLESQCQRWFVTTLRWLVCLRYGLGKLSNAYGGEFGGGVGTGRQVRRLFVGFQRFFQVECSMEFRSGYLRRM
jgi:hypothetical protein